MQKFKHNNVDIWIWKFCLLKIYFNYRELMIIGWLTAEGWLRLMNTTYWKKKITRKKFSLNSQIFSALEALFPTLLDEDCWRSIYRRGFGLEIPLNLQSWKFFKSITCRDSWGNEVCRGRIFFLFFVRDLKRENFSLLSFSHHSVLKQKMALIPLISWTHHRKQTSY